MNTQIRPSDRAWREKANRIIGELSLESWRQANVRKDGAVRRKHVPYSVPQLAQVLVECLNKNDEERAKAIFQRLNISPEYANDPENR